MKTVLIVDDSATILLSLEGLLARAGFRVAKAGDGYEALEKLQAGLRPDLVITDLHMPGMDGISLVREVRRRRAFRFVPILMLTTESQQAKRREARAAGATGWLVKPVGADHLLGVLRRVLPGTETRLGEDWR